jgi:outer membrane protein TolC
MRNLLKIRLGTLVAFALLGATEKYSDLAEIRLKELLSVVQLYKALGGGWQ